MSFEAIEDQVKEVRRFPSGDHFSDVMIESLIELHEGRERIILDTDDSRNHGFAEHGKRSREFIIDAMDRCENTDQAMFWGVGMGVDIPIGEALQRFNEVVLLDICVENVFATLGRLIETGEIQPTDLSKIVVIGEDLTGIQARFIKVIEESRLRYANDGAFILDLRDRLVPVLQELQIPQHVAPEFLVGDRPPDFLSSWCVASQLPTLIQEYVVKLVPEKVESLIVGDDLDPLIKYLRLEVLQIVGTITQESHQPLIEKCMGDDTITCFGCTPQSLAADAPPQQILVREAAVPNRNVYQVLEQDSWRWNSFFRENDQDLHTDVMAYVLEKSLSEG